MSRDVDISIWEQAQTEEKIFWELQNYDIPKCYDIKYKNLRSFIDNTVKPRDTNVFNVLDVGCGAIAYSICCGLKNVVLCDPLIDSYINLPNAKQNISGHALLPIIDGTKICALDNIFNTIFFLNVLDHTQNPDAIFSEVVRVCKKYILFYCDIRDKTDGCHPQIITQDYIYDLERGHNLKVLEQYFDTNEGLGLQSYAAIYEKQ